MSVSILYAHGIKTSSLITPKLNIIDEPLMRVDRLFPPIAIVLALAAFLLLFGLDSRPFWQDEAELTALWQAERRFAPSMANDQREALFANWHRAIQRTLGWARS